LSGNRSSLFLFTLQYPYGTGESFIENELSELASKFGRIYVLPFSFSGPERELPSNVEVIKWNEGYSYQGGRAFRKHFLAFLKIFLFEYYRSGNKSSFRKNSAELRSSLLQNLVRAESITNVIKKYGKPDSVFYTYWFEDWATILGILRNKDIIPHYFSRAHGFDLYKERRKDSLMPYRYFQMNTVKTVFPVSDAGAAYLRKEFPSFSGIIKRAYLGVYERGTNPFDPEGIFTMVSCSGLIPVKRIHLIIEALKKVKIDLVWIHFGDGFLKNDLIERCHQLPSNIRVEFKGQMNNEQIIDYYQTRSVNLFINVSESEGIPVSIMEAISFSIPVIATNVGGVSEIANKSTGILLDPDFDTEILAEAINGGTINLLNSVEYKVERKNFWRKNFNAKENYESFYLELIKD
jgi:glycosyltransferase involved in cell wall biosynthesis